MQMPRLSSQVPYTEVVLLGMTSSFSRVWLYKWNDIKQVNENISTLIIAETNLDDKAGRSAAAPKYVFYVYIPLKTLLWWDRLKCFSETDLCINVNMKSQVFVGDFVFEGIGLKKCFAGNFRVSLVCIGPSFFCLVLTVPLYVNMF